MGAPSRDTVDTEWPDVTARSCTAIEHLWAIRAPCQRMWLLLIKSERHVRGGDCTSGEFSRRARLFFFPPSFSFSFICTGKPVCKLGIQKSWAHIKLLNVLRDETFSPASSHLPECTVSGYRTALFTASCRLRGQRKIWKLKPFFLKDFSVRRWFCSLGVRYITFSIFCG